MSRKTDVQSVASIILDGMAQLLAFTFSTSLLPIAAVARAIRWLLRQDRVYELHLQYQQSHHHIALEARRSVKYLKTYLREYERLVSEFRQGNYQTPQEAQAAFLIFKLAEADLLARAQREALGVDDVPRLENTPAVIASAVRR